MYCVQCDNKFSAQQYNSYLKMCNYCSGKQRFSMEVEFEHPTLDFGVLLSDTLTRLCLEFKEAKNEGFHPSLGACPKIKILSAKDNFTGELINPNLINKMLEKK